MDARKFMMHKKKVFDIFQDDPFINKNKKNWGKNIVDSRVSSGFKYECGHYTVGPRDQSAVHPGRAVCA